MPWIHQGICVGDSPEGPLKTTGGILLKTCKKPKRNTCHLSAHTGHDPHYGGPRDPPEWPSQKLPRAGSASLKGSCLPRAGSASLEGSRLPRAGSASLEGSRLPRAGSASLEGSRLPRARSASLEGTSPPRSRPPHEHTCSRTRVRTFNALIRQSCAIMRLGITPRRCSANSLGGNPSPPLWGTVRHGQCQLRGTVPPTPVRLTRRPLEGGPATPSNHFLANLQGQTMTLGRWDAIPATVGPVRPPPCLQHHAGHCYNNSGAVEHAGTRRRHTCHCTSYGSPSTASSSPSEDAPANHYALAHEAATVRVKDTP
jgi:hypothetical protein